MRSLAMILALAFTMAAAGQTVTFRSEFEAAKKAAEAGDAPAYLEHMRAAMQLEHDRGGRPFYQYNLARALAMNGRNDEALETLAAIWNERIEGPMIMYADFDPAFAPLRATPGYAKVAALMDGLELEVSPAGGKVVEIQGAGCTIAASIGPDGVLLVDTGYPRITSSLTRALRKRTGGEPRVRYVLMTHGHFDHAAANRKAGPNAVIVGHPDAAAAMQQPVDFLPGLQIPASPAEAQPDITSAGPLTIRFNGESVRVVPLVAHSPGDVVVWFPDSRVLHMGDAYFGADSSYVYPGPDPATFYAALASLLADVPDDAVVLSGHAPRVTASVLKATLARSRELFAAVRDGLAAGKTRDAIVAEAEERGHARRWAEFFLGALTK